LFRRPKLTLSCSAEGRKEGKKERKKERKKEKPLYRLNGRLVSHRIYLELVATIKISIPEENHTPTVQHMTSEYIQLQKFWKFV
jgi:transcriptional regulator of NAD metabolism